MLSRLLWCLVLVSGVTVADDHAHHHGEQKPIKRPRVFLDKKPRIVEYQLRRLDNARLLLVETATDHPRYIPVFRAILTRAGMSRRNREDALAALVTLRNQDAVAVLLDVLKSLRSRTGAERQTVSQLLALFVQQPSEALQGHAIDFSAAVATSNEILQRAGFCGLLAGQQVDAAWRQAGKSDMARQAWLQALRLLPASTLPGNQRERVLTLLTPQNSTDVRREAVATLAALPGDPADTFRRLVPAALEADLQRSAVRGLLNVPQEHRDMKLSSQLVHHMVDLAESTAAADRTTDEFLDAMQLADQLLGRIPPNTAKQLRERLDEVTVRVVRLRTVEEEMRFDEPYFVVQAGRPVQLVLENDDVMPHNLVITAPGRLKPVALDGAALGNTPGRNGELYIPDTPDVLYATRMVNAGRRDVLTFTAPAAAGEYPYVCTFPRHWMRMYGVMLVVPDLDAWQRNPVPPADPLGNTRGFVRNWTIDDFDAASLQDSSGAHSEAAGARLFREATCLSCHRMQGVGGAVGPELTGVLKRLDGNPQAVLREILEPSYRIDPKYAVQVVIDNDGRTTSGIVTAETKKTLSLLVNPEAKEPTVIQKSEIDEVVPSATSMMPKALLDRFEREEILELLHYVIHTH